MWVKLSVYWQSDSICESTLVVQAGTRLQKVPISLILLVPNITQENIWIAAGHLKLPNGPFEIWWKQISFSHRLYVFSLDWTFPYRWATASYRLKCFWRRLSLSWGIPVKLHSDQGTHFTGQVIQQECAVGPALHFHCAYHSQLSDLVECIKDIIKT